MDMVRTALSHHLDLASSGVVEFRGLVAGSDLELLDALDGRRHHAGGRSAGSSGAAVTIAGRICGVRAGHVVAVVTTVQTESVLVRLSSGYIAVERDTDLQYRERGGVASEVRK